MNRILSRMPGIFRKPLLWVGFLASVVPLVIILNQQVSLFDRLQVTLSAYQKMGMKDYLAEVSSRAADHYRQIADDALAVPASAFTQNRLDIVRSQFRDHLKDGVAALFVTSFLPGDARQLLCYQADTDQLVGARDPKRDLAVNTALAPWRYLAAKRAYQPLTRTVPDETDHAFRMLVRPVADENGMLVGAAGFIVDQGYFRDKLVPRLMREALKNPYYFHSQSEVSACLYNETGKLVYCTNPGTTNQRDDETTPFPTLFTDWKLGVHTVGQTPEQDAKRSLIVNLFWSAIVFLCLCGGIVLTLRTASEEMRLSQMKSDFVSNVSHELRTPLASIRVFGEF